MQGAAWLLLCSGPTWQAVSNYQPKGQSPVFIRVNSPFNFNHWGKEICLFKEGRAQFLVVEFIKNGWCLKLLEELEMMPVCHWLRTEGCPSWFSGPASVGSEGQVWAVKQNQPLAGGKEVVINTVSDMLWFSQCTQSSCYFYRLFGRVSLIFIWSPPTGFKFLPVKNLL